MSPTTPLNIPTATRGGLRVSVHVVFRPKVGLCFELKSKAVPMASHSRGRSWLQSLCGLEGPERPGIQGLQRAWA